MYNSITTDQFKSFFLSYFSSNPAISSIDWDTWLSAPGMPPYKPNFDTTLAVKSRELAAKWVTGNIPEDNKEFEEFSAEQKLEFLEILLESDKLEHEKLEKMDNMYRLSTSPNTEVLFVFNRIGIKARWEKAWSWALILPLGRAG